MSQQNSELSNDEKIKLHEAKIQNIEMQVQALAQKMDKLINLYLSNGNSSSESLLQVRPSVVSEVQESNLKKQANRNFNFLPLIALICFVLAGVFMVKMSIDTGWLTKERQWGLLASFSGVLIAGGLWLFKIEENYRQYLSAGGAILSFVAVFSGHLYFDIYSAEASLLLGALCSLLCIFLQKHHHSELFSIVTAVGTYLSPILLGDKQDLFFHAAYFIIWSGLFATISIHLRSRMLPLVASYLGLGVFAALNLSPNVDLPVVIACQIIQFFVFAFGVYRQSVITKVKLSAIEANAYLPVLLFFYGTTYFYLNRWSASLAPWISLGFAAALFLIYRLANAKIQNLNSKMIVESFLGVVLIHSGYLQILPSSVKPALLPAFLFFNLLSREKNYFPTLSKIVKFAIAVVAILELGNICLALITKNDHYQLPFAVATIILAFLNYSGMKFEGKSGSLFLTMIHVLAALSIYNIAYEHGSFAISFGWGLYATLVLAYGWKKHNKEVIKSSLVVLLLASVKALVFDATQSASGIRIASLLVTGVILYFTGWIFNRVNSWK